MFRKVVSNLPYSPALVSQLGFYAGRLRREEATRRIGLVFTALALLVQSFAVITPPEPANAASNSDLIRGGVSSTQGILAVYDASSRGNGDFKDIMDYVGITRAELANTKRELVNSRKFGTGENSLRSWGRVSRFSAAQGEVSHVVPLRNGGTSTLYSRPYYNYEKTAAQKQRGLNEWVYVGYSAKIGWFGIMQNCGNLMIPRDPRPVPNGKVSATCSAVTGYAYDARKAETKVNVYLYFGGPPGKGDRRGPIVANASAPNSPLGNGYGFSYAVPSSYQYSTTPTPVYAVMTPLPGWPQSTVSIGSATIPANCFTPKPIAECVEVKAQLIERTKYRFNAESKVSNGAKVKSYTFVVKDSSGKVVDKKTTVSTETEVLSPEFTLTKPGDYTVSLTVATSEGDKTSDDCLTTFAVDPPEPCPGDPVISIDDENCKPDVTEGKEAQNLTQNRAAAGSVANSGDRIEYTVYLENVGKLATEVEFKEELSDVLEYATIKNAGGGKFDEDKKVLSWGDVKLSPGEKQVRKFVIEVASVIPSTPQGISDRSSYDCTMTNTFGNSIDVKVNCPTVKGVENVVSELPSTGPTENAIFGSIVAMVVTYFYARTRQLKKETRLVRQEFTAGTL